MAWKDFWEGVKCLFDFHDYDPPHEKSAVFYIGDISGARPFREVTRRCARCGLHVNSTERAEGPGLIP